MTLLIEIWSRLFWLLIGFGMGVCIILELVKGIVDEETWQKINYSNALPNELKNQVSKLLSLENQERG